MIVLSVVTGASAIAACGSSSTPSSTTAATSPQFALAKCMRSHGVPNFPDPTSGPGGEGFSILQSAGSSSVTINGIAFSGPAFHAAQKACQSAGSLGAPAPISGAQKEAFVAKAHCIRTHGVSNFPDPSFGPGGYGVGINLPVGFNSQSPAFVSAAKACASVGAPIPGVG
jgi:hypothetical protein